ncbi:MAG: 30S ribosomal protein S17 [bacterium]|nr:30S ribosomal protein S17 [bacterium]
MARKLIGKVISDKMNKTVIVAIERLKAHPIYKKKYKVTTKFKAHDEENSYRPGDLVEIIETKPISKQKKFIVIAKVEKKKGIKK